MRCPIERVRPLAEDEVDRAGMEVQQCMELAATNRPRAWPREASLARKGRGGCVQYAVLRVYAKYPNKARWLSWLEHRPVTAGVDGSNPFRVVFL